MKTCTKLEQNLHKPKLAYQSKLVADVIADIAYSYFSANICRDISKICRDICSDIAAICRHLQTFVEI